MVKLAIRLVVNIYKLILGPTRSLLLILWFEGSKKVANDPFFKLKLREKFSLILVS